MAQQWQFVEDERHQWHWQRTEDKVKSSAAFSSATECMLDAVRNAVHRRRTLVEFPRSELLQ